MSATPPKQALERHRKRRAARGMARFEVVGLEGDRELIRSLARRLAAGDAGASRLRAAVRRAISEAESKTGAILDALRRSPLVGAELDLNRPAISERTI